MLNCGHACQPTRRSQTEWEVGFRGLKVPIGPQNVDTPWLIPKNFESNRHKLAAAASSSQQQKRSKSVQGSAGDYHITRSGRFRTLGGDDKSRHILTSGPAIKQKDWLQNGPPSPGVIINLPDGNVIADPSSPTHGLQGLYGRKRLKEVLSGKSSFSPSARVKSKGVQQSTDIINSNSDYIQKKLGQIQQQNKSQQQQQQQQSNLSQSNQKNKNQNYPTLLSHNNHNEPPKFYESGQKAKITNSSTGGFMPSNYNSISLRRGSNVSTVSSSSASGTNGSSSSSSATGQQTVNSSINNSHSNCKKKGHHNGNIKSGGSPKSHKKKNSNSNSKQEYVTNHTVPSVLVGGDQRFGGVVVNHVDASAIDDNIPEYDDVYLNSDLNENDYNQDQAQQQYDEFNPDVFPSEQTSEHYQSQQQPLSHLTRNSQVLGNKSTGIRMSSYRAATAPGTLFTSPAEGAKLERKRQNKKQSYYEKANRMIQRVWQQQQQTQQNQQQGQNKFSNVNIVNNNGLGQQQTSQNQNEPHFFQTKGAIIQSHQPDVSPISVMNIPMASGASSEVDNIEQKRTQKHLDSIAPSKLLHTQEGKNNDYDYVTNNNLLLSSTKQLTAKDLFTSAIDPNGMSLHHKLALPNHGITPQTRLFGGSGSRSCSRSHSRNHSRNASRTNSKSKSKDNNHQILNQNSNSNYVQNQGPSTMNTATLGQNHSVGQGYQGSPNQNQVQNQIHPNGPITTLMSSSTYNNLHSSGQLVSLRGNSNGAISVGNTNSNSHVTSNVSKSRSSGSASRSTASNFAQQLHMKMMGSDRSN